jgi:hypothetical protein
MNDNIEYTDVNAKAYVMLCSFVHDSDGYNLDCILKVEGLYNTHTIHVWVQWTVMVNCDHSESYCQSSSVHIQNQLFYSFMLVSIIQIITLSV